MGLLALLICGRAPARRPRERRDTGTRPPDPKVRLECAGGDSATRHHQRFCRESALTESSLRVKTKRNLRPLAGEGQLGCGPNKSTSPCHRLFVRLKDIFSADFCHHGLANLPAAPITDDGG